VSTTSVRIGAELTPGGATLAGQFFPGSGEMASLIRARDWSTTPLGAIEEWPQSLRTAVSICVGSRHPFVLWWGPERWMFYNDGYRPMLGEKMHPQFLGRPGRECWAEIWDIIGPMMEKVLETGEATWAEDMFLLMQRSGYLEETYFTFSYSPIRDEQGRANGIFNACTETTAQVLAERRMATLRQLVVQARTVDEAVHLCAEALRRNRHDIPFALVYLLDDLGQELTLAAHVGLPPGTPASPIRVALSEPHQAGWPLACVARQAVAELVDDLAFRFDCLPGEPWGEPSHQAMLLPIGRPGWHLPAGVLVLGISPRRAFDDQYRAFFDLVIGHVGTAVSGTRAYAEERARADKLAELDRVKTAFFSNVSHEFRTPLTMIIGPVEDALADPARSLRSDSLDAVHRNALRLLRLVNDLLDFSRVERSATNRVDPTEQRRQRFS
jgi:GAF domain-containing protein